MGYSRIQLSLSEIYWHGRVESNKTVFLISKPSRQDSRRNIGNKDAMAKEVSASTAPAAMKVPVKKHWGRGVLTNRTREPCLHYSSVSKKTVE